ncbi:MAG: hypothetical protein RLY16_2803 [Bacteroidota bacterium]
MNKNRGLLLLWFACFGSFKGMCQTFNFQAPIQAITQDGFYTFWTTPDVSSSCAVDLHDLRIKEVNGTWVPHYIRSSMQMVKKQLWKPLVIKSNQLIDSGNTALIIENEARNPIPQLCLLTRQTTVKRKGKLSGSNDLQHWFVIADRVDLYPQYQASVPDQMYMHVGACAGGYRYYRLFIQNDGYDPLPIEGVGQVEGMPISSIPAVAPIKLNVKNTFQKDSTNGYSYYRFAPPTAAVFDQLELSIPSPKFFDRNATLYSVSVNAKGSEELDFLTDLQLRAGADTMNIHFPKSKATHYLLRVTNGDNPPLHLQHVAFLFQPQALVFYLEKNKQYALQFGNYQAVPPVYDLQNFADSIAPVLPVVQIGTITKMAATNEMDESKKSWSDWITWGAILFSMLILAWFSVKMIGERKDH